MLSMEILRIYIVCVFKLSLITEGILIYIYLSRKRNYQYVVCEYSTLGAQTMENHIKICVVQKMYDAHV